jgi:hypothetical protein
MTATGSNGSGTTTASGTATVSVPSGASLSYVAGSTQVINYNDHSVIATLDDNITTSKGTSAGNLAGSTNEWVQYKAKVSCVTPPKEIQVCELSTKKVITINEDQFDSAKHSKDLSKCETVTPPVTPPTELANTGPGQVAGIVAATVVAATAGANFVLRRRAARQ